MAKYVAEVKYLCSIYPGKLDIVGRPFGPDPKGGKGGRWTNYWIPPVLGKKVRHPAKVPNVTYGDGWNVLEISDMFQNELDPIKTAERGGRQAWVSNMVDCKEIVADVLKHWTQGMVGIPEGASPGIKEIANVTPTQADLEELRERQTRFYEYLFQEGERLHTQNSWKEITQTMRDGAIWLGRDREWSTPGLGADKKQCPACFEYVHQEASRCPKCQAQIRAMPKELSELHQPVAVA